MAYNYTNENFDLLGKDIGIEWRPFEERILANKYHGPAGQGLLDIQVRTRPGDLPGNDGTFTGGAMSVLSEINEATKYGVFNFVAKAVNYSRYAENVDRFFGHAASCLYADQMFVDSTPCWATAIEVKEVHGQANPINGSLAIEATVIAAGTDNNNKRCNIFLPFNYLKGHEATYTEFAQGIYFKTVDKGMKVKDAMLLQGRYGNILRADDVTADSLLTATGSFTGPVIDLGFISNISNSAAIQMNVVHHLQWTTADHNVTQRIGRRGDTMFIDGLPWSGTAGAHVGFVTIEMNGTRLKVPAHLEN